MFYKMILLIFVAGFPQLGLAQRAMRSIPDSLQLVIRGPGYFWMINPESGERRVTRDGNMKIDVTGHLVHWEHGDRFMNGADGYSDIKITDYAKYIDPETGEESNFHRYEIRPDATLIAVYENGARRQIAKLAIVDFADPLKLLRISQHVLVPTDESGLPRTDGASIVYSPTRD